ncbi:MAG: hydrophobic protein [Acidobacteria bacterium]|nr:hydrophobic protein [Acidobacteriota bacterium]
MIAALVVLFLLLLLFGGGGFLSTSLQFLWFVLIVALVLWAIGFLVRGTSGSRWYYW